MEAAVRTPSDVSPSGLLKHTVGVAKLRKNGFAFQETTKPVEFDRGRLRQRVSKKWGCK